VISLVILDLSSALLTDLCFRHHDTRSVLFPVTCSARISSAFDDDYSNCDAAATRCRGCRAACGELSHAAWQKVR
jgi:hypothetical protein